MIKKIFDSVSDNIRQKTTNPFLGTLIIVWIIHNWELLYRIFNFDTSYTLKNKVDYIKLFLDTKPFLLNLLTCIWVTILVLIVTYALLNLARCITNLYEKRLTPWIYKITDSKSVVLKEDYERLFLERDALQKRLDLEKDAKIKLELQLDKLSNEYSKMKDELFSATINSKNKNENENEKKSILSKIETELKNKRIIEAFKNDSVLKVTFQRVIEDIKLKKPTELFNERVKQLAFLGIIETEKALSNELGILKLTALGELLFDKYRNDVVL